MDDTMTNTLPVLPVHPFTGLTAVGVLPSGKVVWPVLGGSGEGDDAPEEQADEETAEQETDDAADADETAEDEKPEPKPDEKPVSRAELRKVIADRDTAKKALRDLRRELDEVKRANETADETARREAAEAAQKAADAKYKPISARAALLEAGVKPSRVKGALKLLDMDEIEIDADGEVTGLDSQVTGLREEWPELFADTQPEPEKKAEVKRPARGADGANKPAPPKKEMSVSERQAALLLGKG
ncbi:phage scaffolding protein [Microbispora sp. KK1-11]|uniref:phage scaffolding protein n=1 Tax=Microbispora sp. KK1-11 TaxID=2053005 RepID=UPI00115B897D|nr:phage scaffolding protein [Microbispora sp. KK1-11]TQS30038.1 hypothetical protein FLW16_06670 [Microbispora sp. KK1-11]